MTRDLPKYLATHSLSKNASQYSINSNNLHKENINIKRNANNADLLLASRLKSQKLYS